MKTQSYLNFISRKITYKYIEEKILNLKKLEICLIGDPILDPISFVKQRNFIKVNIGLYI